MPNRQQAIIWTSNAIVYWGIYASLGLNGLKWAPCQQQVCYWFSLPRLFRAPHRIQISRNLVVLWHRLQLSNRFEILHGRFYNGDRSYGKTKVREVTIYIYIWIIIKQIKIRNINKTPQWFNLATGMSFKLFRYKCFYMDLFTLLYGFWIDGEINSEKLSNAYPSANMSLYISIYS